MKDYYKILNANRNASDDEIKRAYRELALKYHPDVAKDLKSSLRFTEINEAYQVLGKKDSRDSYNLKYDYENYGKINYPAGQRERGKESQAPFTARRFYGPAYVRKDERVDLTPYIRSMRILSGFSFFFVLLVIVDYFLPTEIHEQTIQAKMTTYNSYNSIVIATESYEFPLSYENSKLIYKGDKARVFLSPIFNIHQKLFVDNGIDSFEFKPHYSIYNVYSFFLIILMATSYLGSVHKSNNPELVFSAGIVNIFLAGLIMFLIYIS